MTMDEIKRGRELDALVAEKVFGLRVRRATLAPDGGLLVFTGDREWLQEGEPYWTDENGTAWVVPNYSTEIAAAWRAVDRMTAMGYQFELSFVPCYEPEPWLALFFVPPRRVGSVSSAFAATAPEAICRAALLAVERTQEHGAGV